MSAPRPTPQRPLRVLVVGSSSAVMMEPPRRHRDEGTYGELLPRLLSAAGVATTGTVHGQWFGTIQEVRRRYEHAVRDHFPDVLVLNFGLVECQGHVVPTGLVRHFTTWDQATSTVGRWYRRHVAPWLWRAVRRWQRFAHRRVGDRTARLAPRRFQREVRRVVELARRDIRPLVLLLDIDPPGPRVLHWLPGIDRRVARYNRLMQDVAAAFDDREVRLVRTSRVVADLGSDIALPDGLHRSAAGHRAVAELLAAEIRGWLGSTRSRDGAPPEPRGQAALLDLPGREAAS